VRRLRAVLALRIVRIDWPWPALKLQRPDGTGWLICPLSLDPFISED
jgi:hypothetical protein